MSVVVDSSAVIAMYHAGDTHNADITRWGRANEEELVLTPLALAEVDYVLPRRTDAATQRAFWQDLDAGAFTVRWWASGLPETLAIAREHPDIGLTDASLVALARMLRTTSIATFDVHFETFDLTLVPERQETHG